MITGSAPVSDDAALWAALSHMHIATANGVSFEEALAKENGWSRAFAERVAREYRRFLYLAAIAGFEVTPSRNVDQAWHLHLTLPHYRDTLCGRILRRPLDHLPGTGTPEDDARCARQYEDTLSLYERVFGEPASSDIWPHPIDVEDSGGVERRRGIGSRIGLAAAAAGVVAGLAAPAVGTPALTPVLLIGAAWLALVCLPFEALLGVGRRRGSAGCGGSCGGSGGDGAACGGGGCGGGCGGGD